MNTIAPAQPSPEAVEALYATGHWLFTQARIGDAQGVFRALVYVAPEDERGWLALGACYESEGDDDVALELYAAASAVTTAPLCDVARARILRKRGDGAAARHTLDEVARLAEGRRDHQTLALVHAERGRP